MEHKKRAKEEVAAETSNWEDYSNELPDLPALVEEYKEISDNIKALEGRKKELSPEIEAAIITGGKKAMACGAFRLTHVKVEGRKSVAPERVVEKAAEYGLNAEQITDMLEYATVQGPGYSYPLVSRVE